MFDIDRNLQIVIVVFICILVLIYKKKQKMMFHEDGKVKEFGSGPNKTITPVWVVSLSVCLLIYIQFTVREGDFV